MSRMIIFYKIVLLLIDESKFVLQKFLSIWDSIFWKVLVVILSASFLFIFPLKVIDFYNAPFPVEVVSDHKIIYSVDFCKYFDYPFTMVRYIAAKDDSKRWYLWELTNNWRFNLTHDECSQEKPSNSIVSLDIPSYIKPGEYHIEIQIIYKINIIHKKSIDLQTKNFILK